MGYDHLVNGTVLPQIPSTNNADASTNIFAITPWDYPPVNNTSSLEESLRTVDISSATSSTTNAPPRGAPLLPYSLTDPIGPKMIGLPQYIDPSDAQPIAPILSWINSDKYGPLPPGWQMRTVDLGRNYYVDHNTRTTTWHRPSFNQGVNGVVQQVASSNPLEPLPAGWEERRTPEGRVYFVDRKSKLDSRLGAKAK